MDEVQAFCLRMLGLGPGAGSAEQSARVAAVNRDRVALLAAAVAECRNRTRTDTREARGVEDSDWREGSPFPERPSDADLRAADSDRGADPATEDPKGPTEPERGDDPRGGEPGTDEPPTLAEAVAAELARATGRIPVRQREALALSELLRLTHEEIGGIVGVEPAEVAPLLARSRLRLRTELRGEGPATPECPERDRSLRMIALRQDGEAVPDYDDDWLVEHLGHCPGCARAHAAMLEASACYRAWPLPEISPGGAGE